MITSHQEKNLEALFVNGMGRSPLSGWPLMRALRRSGLQTSSFGYVVASEDFRTITERLATRISRLAEQGDYVVIGHSLGGLLLRAALNTLPPGVRLPKYIFLLGSPVRSSRIAVTLNRNPVFRALTRDCGQLLGSEQRMAEIGTVRAVPIVGIAGIKGWSWKHGPFGAELNDGVVSLSEVSAEWLTEQVTLPVVHTLLPASKQVIKVILKRLGQCDDQHLNLKDQ